MKIDASKEFHEWFDALPLKTRGLIESRVSRIEENEHFGDCKSIKGQSNMAELRWKNGLRIYFIRLSESILLLKGGRKNEQKKQIKKAKLLAKKYASNETEE